MLEVIYLSLLSNCILISHVAINMHGCPLKMLTFWQGKKGNKLLNLNVIIMWVQYVNVKCIYLYVNVNVKLVNV